MNIHNTDNFEKRTHLTPTQFANEKLYGVGMNMSKKLLDKGIISEQDFLEISDKLARKYSPIIG